jgi:hypothetical protein
MYNEVEHPSGRTNFKHVSSVVELANHLGVAKPFLEGMIQ